MELLEVLAAGNVLFSSLLVELVECDMGMLLGIDLNVAIASEN